MLVRHSLSVATLLAASSLSAQVFVTDTSNLVAYYNFESTGTTGIANQVSGSPASLNGAYLTAASGASGGAGFAGNAAFQGYNANGGALSSTDRSDLLVGNALNVAKSSSGGAGHFTVAGLTANGSAAANGTTVTLGSNFTISSWFYLARDPDNTATTGDAARHYVFESRYAFGSTTTSTFDVSWGTNATANNTPTYVSYVGEVAAVSQVLAAGQWHHTQHSFSSNGTTTTLITYVNGLQVGNAVTANTSAVAFSGINFGTNRGTAPRVFDGMLDEVTAWKSTLSAHDAYISYNLGLAGVATNASIALRTKSDNTSALNDSGSWGGTAPGAGDLLLFSNTFAQAGAVDLGGNVAVRGLRVTTGSGLVDITAAAGTLSVGGLGIDLFAAARDLRVASLTATADQIWQVASGRTLTVTSLAGSSAVNKRGAGTLSLGATSDFSSSLTLTEGSLDLGTLGSGATLILAGGTLSSANSLTLAGGTVQPLSATRVVANNLVLQEGTTSSLIGAGTNDLIYSGSASGSGSANLNSTVSRSVWLQGDWSAFTGTLTFTTQTGGTNYRLGGEAGTTNSSDTTNASDFSQAKFVLQGTGADRALVWNGLAGATVRIGELSGTGGRINVIGSSRAANWEVGALGTSSTYSGTIEGTGNALTKVGAGTLTLSGANTHTGGTTVSAGGLNVTGSLAGPVSVASGATLSGTGTLSGAVTVSSGGAISLANGAASTLVVGSLSVDSANLSIELGDLLNLGSGELALAGTNTLTLAGAIAAGTYQLISFGSQSGLGTLNLVTPGRFSATPTLGVSSYSVVLTSPNLVWNGGSGTWDTSAANWLLNGESTALLDGEDVAIGGSADQTLTVAAGMLPGNVTFSTVAGTTTIAGAGFGGIGSVTKSGAGTLLLESAVSTTGAIAVNEGTLRLASGGSLASAAALTIVSGATFDLDGRSQSLGSLAGAGSVALGSGALTVSGAADASFSGVLSGSGSLSKSGAGTLTLGGSNTHGGTTTVAGGSLRLAAADALGSSTLSLSGGSVAFDDAVESNAFALGAISGSGNLVLSNNAGSPAAVALTVGANNASTTYSGVLSGTGSLVKSGTGALTLSGANTHTGGTTVNAGTLLIGHASALGSGALTLGGGTLASSSSAARTLSQSVAIDGDVTLGQSSGGTGRLVLAGAVDLGGSTRTLTTNAGVAIRGDISNGSLVKAGDGTLVLGGTPSLTSLTVTAGKTLVTGAAGLGNATVTLAGGELRLQAAGDLSGNLVLSGSAASNRLSLGLEVDYLVVGGGGGGSARDSAGGGGGGGVISNLLVGGGSPVLLAPGTLSVVVGAGGAGAVGPDGGGDVLGGTGASSTFGAFVALGGGGGGGYSIAGSTGATGGGSGRASTVATSGTAGQGFAGGGGSGGSSSAVDTGGGGGGAGGAGQAGLASSKGGNGGIGLQVDILGSPVYYGGGGGGSPHRSSSLSGGLGGLGGGGNAATSSSVAPSDGQANTGGGGGASRNASTTDFNLSSGGDGGSGLVIVRYLGDASATGGTITAGTGEAAGYTFHTFSTVGESQFILQADRRVAGVISGDGGFTFATPGHRLFLDATNTYSGGTNVDGGILVANASGALGSGAVSVASGGILQAAIAGSLGSGSVSLGSGARLDVQAVGAIGAASVVAGSGSVVGFRTDGLTLAQISTEASAITWQNGSLLALDTTGGDFTLDQEFQPDAALAKTGANNLTFAVGNSVRSASVTVVEGGVRLGADNALGSSNLVLAAGTSLASDSSAARAEAVGLSLQGNVTLGDTVADGALAIAGATDLGGAIRTLTVASDVTLAGAVANGGITKTGAGSLTLSGNNTFASGITVSAGSLRLGSAGALGSGALTLGADVALSSDSSTARTAANALALSGNVILGDAVADGALTLSGSVDLGGATRTLTVESASTLSGVVSNGGLTKAGAGTLTLAGATTFAGPLTVSAGTLAVTGSNSNGAASVSVQSGATLDLRGGLGLFRTGDFSGTVTHVTATGGTLVVDKFNYGDGGNFNQLRNNYYAFALSNGARIRHTANEEFLRAVTIGAGGAVFETDAGVTVTKLAGNTSSQNLTRFSANSTLTFAGAGTYILEDSLAPASWGSTGFALAKQDSGTLRLTGAASAYTGGTAVTGGRLEFASGALGSTGAVSVDGGTLAWLSGNTQDLSSRLSLGASGATLDVAAGTVSLATGIAAAGNLTKAGAGRLDLESATTVAGLLAVDAGTLSVGSVGALGSGAVTLGSGAVLRLALGLTDDTLLSTSILGGDDTIIDVDHGNELLALSFGGLGTFSGRLRLTSGLVDLTGYNGGIIFDGGSVAGDLSSLTVPVEVASGAILSAANGLPAQVILGPGGTIDFFGASEEALSRVIVFSGGTLANAEQFAGTLRIQGNVSVGNALLGGSNLATVEVRAGSTASIDPEFDGAIRYMGGEINGLANYLGTMTVDGSLGPVQISLGTSALPLSVGASFNLTSGGRLVGTGIVGDLTVASGGVLAPGNSPGVIEAGNLALLSGGGVELEFLNSNPVVGVSPGVDHDVVRAFDLDLSALSSSQPFNLDLISLSDANTGGTIAGWDSALEQSWDIYEYFSLTLSNDYEQFRLSNLTSLFLIDSTGFFSESGQAILSNRFAIIDTGSSLRLAYSPIPEPSTYGLALGALALAGAALRRRRKPAQA
jgi:autotransporter-associated beta strand protein